MELRISTLGKLARMVCGDEPYNDFPYRSSSYLTSFFEELDLDYVHDGSTRFWWVRSVLSELNQLEELSEEFPSGEIVKVIEYLLDPDHFSGSDDDQEQAIGRVNEILQRYELQVIKQKNGTVKLATSTENYVSTAMPQQQAQKVITFAPAVFKVPENEPLNNIVSVMMPFSAEFDAVYQAIKDACDLAELKCYRADDIWEESTFIQDIFNLIYQSMAVVVDFSGRNSNVMYETGIAHTLGKNVVPITQNIDDIPSDLKPHRALKYLPNNEGLNDLRDGLSKRLMTLKKQMGG